MRKVIAAIVLCCGLNTAHAQFAAYWNFANYVQNPEAIRQVNLTELWNITASGTNIIVGQRQSKQTDLNGRLVVSNMVYGAYRIDFIGQTFTNSFTNVFGPNTTGLTNALFAIGVSTNSVTGDGYAYTRNQSDGRFMQITPSPSVGYVATATDLIGGFDWEPGGGAGGGITLAQGSNIVNGAIGVITTNGAARGTTFQFSATGTNVINAIINTWSNAFVSIFGTAAYRSTNSFAAIDQDGGETISGLMTASGFMGDGSQLTHLNASAINAGTVPPANLGSGSSITTKFLRGDSTWVSISGGGDMLAANNLSDVADAATARANIGANSAANLSTGTLPDARLQPDVLTNNLPRTFTNTGWQIDQWLVQTNPANHALNFSNTVYGSVPFSIQTNGILLIGGVPLVDGSALKANQYASTDGSTNLVSTQNGFSWTNLDTHFTNYGAVTNIVLPADGNNWRVLATNGPHNFFSFGGNNMGAMSIWITTNGDAALPPQVTYLGYSDTHTTNCIIDLQPWGGTNRVLAGKSEL